MVGDPKVSPKNIFKLSTKIPKYSFFLMLGWDIIACFFPFFFSSNKQEKLLTNIYIYIKRSLIKIFFWTLLIKIDEITKYIYAI